MKPRPWNLLMALLRTGLWERDTTLASIPDAAQWDAVLDAAHAQAVTGLLLRGLEHLPPEQLPPPSLRLHLMAEVVSLERVSAAQARTEADLLAFFADKGLHPLVMKGSRAARHYLHPELRCCGDIDLFFPGDEFARAKALVPEAVAEPDGSTLFARDGIPVELRPRYYDLHLPPEQLPPPGSVCGELLLLSAHICKHAVGTGVGLKQLCDLARALHATEGRYDKEELRNALRRAKLLRWHRMLCSLLVTDLGLDATCCLPGFRPVRVTALRRIVRSGGNFGQAAPRRQAALHKSAAARKADTAAAFLRRLPFSLYCAPKETCATIRELTRGNLHHKE